ncbi:MAG: Glycogen synthase [Firmicutes bacterium ADurb.Bin153]|nr:MAG: Glycogen synthase [Firmicutes bacterium ADurb.Bin153]
MKWGDDVSTTKKAPQGGRKPKVLFITSEAVPFCKTGGLADVAGSLTPKLAELGAEVRVVLPLYGSIGHIWRERMTDEAEFQLNLGWRKQYCGVKTLDHLGIRWHFVDNEFYYRRESLYGYGDDGERFCFLSKAALDMLPAVGFKPDILHCNDWQTAPIPLLMHAGYKATPGLKSALSVFTIHSMAYQGVMSPQVIDDVLGLSKSDYFKPDRLEFNKAVNLMKGAIVFSDAITTVSRSYAEEILTAWFGEGLDGLLKEYSFKLSGIVNGIDSKSYDPSTDKHIFMNYDKDHMSGKAANKTGVQRMLGLGQGGDKVLMSIISRLISQKGLDLVARIAEEILQDPETQLAVLGTGDPKYEEFFRALAAKHPGRVAAKIYFDEDLARKLYAGSDILLMPSAFEPCGLSQLIAMRYGTLPLVRETGGLKDTVRPYNKFTGEGTGFSFVNYNAHELLETIWRAVGLFRYERGVWDRLVHDAMSVDSSWEKAAGEYMKLYDSLLTKSTKPAKE